MLSLPFYINWDSQQAVRWARAYFNGSLEKHAQLNGGYIIRHPDIVVVTDLGLYDQKIQGDLMDIGYLLMMKDITQKVQTIVALFTVALAYKQPTKRKKNK